MPDILSWPDNWWDVWQRPVIRVTLMKAFLGGIQALPRDVKLFILFNLFANIGFGVFQLVFNLYLIQLDFREDYIGAFNSVQSAT